MTKFKRTIRIAALRIVAPLCFSSTASAAEGDGRDWMTAHYG